MMSSLVEEVLADEGVTLGEATAGNLVADRVVGFKVIDMAQ
jgi:hypothetical protein